MAQNVTQKLIESHLEDGTLDPGSDIALRIDQTLTQDATGTTVMLELEAMGLERVRTELSAQYVDHNLLQTDSRNADDHLFLLSACRKFGIWYSRPGNGVSHPVHQQRFGVAGKSLLGSDSHTPAAGSLGMLAMGAGGLEVALAMAGQPYHIKMPEVWGVRLTGELPDWVSAKDVILEMLRRHDVDGGVGRIIEYYGPGLEALSAMDRHVIANMGTELGATTTVFPSDDVVRRFLAAQGREDDWTEITADEGAGYDVNEEIDLSSLVPLIALPSSPGNVVPVSEVAGDEIYQSYIGSSANPGLRDFAIAAAMVGEHGADPSVSLDINPSSRQTLHNLIELGYLQPLLDAGARIHQAGCNGCIGMGQAPATDSISLRTVPRNFPDRSGTKDDRVYLCSPETATASAIAGRITDPRDLARDLNLSYPRDIPDEDVLVSTEWLVPPPSPEESAKVELRKGPNIVSLPDMPPLPDELSLSVLIKLDDDVSTDEIMPAGNAVLPFRSNVPEIAKFVFGPVDETFHDRAIAVRDDGGGAVVAGHNYGQGSSREHAALAPRHLGIRAKIVKSYARIHRENLVNFGILPLTFVDPEDHDRIEQGDVLRMTGLTKTLRAGGLVTVRIVRDGRETGEFRASPALNERDIGLLLA
ncbi:MAG TPA: aconitate hydratase, partial [Gemmatimonadota bacterium]|nr:aconitate hydratase [Gemmatimonadota bacterium]